LGAEGMKSDFTDYSAAPVLDCMFYGVVASIIQYQYKQRAQYKQFMEMIEFNSNYVYI
jgi:hypothetical protein